MLWRHQIRRLYMFYCYRDRPYLILIPTVAVSIKGEFWIEVDWLHLIFGWRSGRGSDE